MPPKTRKKAVAAAPVTVTRSNARELPAAYYQGIALRTEQIPLRLRGLHPTAVSVAFRMAGGDVRPGRATAADKAWSLVQIGDDGEVLVESSHGALSEKSTR